MDKVSIFIFKKFIDGLMKRYGKGLPEPKFLNTIEKVFMVEMRDGVKLKTDVLFPAEEGDFPVIFVRSPYIHEFDHYKYIFKNFVKYGFILCYQECRGRGKSEGEFKPFEFERNDGIDTVKWLKRQSWYRKKIVPLGVSYLAMNQLLYCDTWDEDFKTAVLVMYGGNLYNLAYENGMFKDDFFTTWAFANNNVKTIDGDEGYDLFRKTADIFPKSELMKKTLGENLEFYDNLIHSPSQNDEIWRTKYFMPPTDKINTPLFLITGWYDFTTKEVLKIYDSLSEDVKKESLLLAGPWNHLMQNTGNKKTPKHYVAGFMGFKYVLRWLLKTFYNVKTNVKSGVEYYTYNLNHYIRSTNLPKFNVSGFYLSEKFKLTKKRTKGNITYIYDPSKPVQTLGGCNASPEFISSRRRVPQCAVRLRLKKEIRDDVLCFESEISVSKRTVLGGYADLCICSSAPDTCFSVKLCAKEGRKTYAFSYGISNIINNCGKNEPYEPGGKRKIRIDLSPVAYKLKDKSKLVLIITSSDYPSFHLHQNTAKIWSEETVSAVAKQTIILDETSLNLFFKKQ